MSRDAVLEAAGSMRAAYEDVDWSATPLGPMSAWSPALCNAVDLALNTRFPVTLMWGPEFVLLYNEAYVGLIADKHPDALGTPARDVFPEAWDTIGPVMEAALAGESSDQIDSHVPLRRHGYLQEAYFTYSYSPVRGSGGSIEGVLDIATETTRHVIDRRRLELLSRLRELLGGIEHAGDVPERALPLLRNYARDLPGVEILHPGESGHQPATAPFRGGVEESGTGRVARFPLSLVRPAVESPILEVRLSENLAPDEAYLGFLELIASALGQAIDRITARETERSIAAAERDMSEVLQRSLLSEPFQPDHLQVAVRYVSAVEQAEVGGDWYDAFMGPDGVLRLVVGDVTGHDRHAVAAMAQVRNLLRGVTFALQEPPAGVLSALDRTMQGLTVGVYATAVLAQVERYEDAAGDRSRTLRWSNAGHPPPVLVAPKGSARLLEASPGALLGSGGGGPRADHTVALEDGATVVFYTDGMIERRSIPLQERLEWLTGVLDACHDLSAEELCDHLLNQLDDRIEDDVALLVLRAHPE